MISQQQLRDFFAAAFRETKRGLQKKHGGPFGAAVIKNGKIISLGHNTVLKDNDPSAHAEVNAIRLAAKKIKSPHLNNCILITTSEPCPMCLSVAYWAKIKQIYYGLPKKIAAQAGFQDDFIYQDLAKPILKRKLNMKYFTPAAKAGKMIFTAWKKHGKLY